VSRLTQRPGTVTGGLAGVGRTAADGVCTVADTLIAFLIANHSSPDSTPSSLVAIGLDGIGVVLVLPGCVLFTGQALVRLWHWARRLRPRRSGGRPSDNRLFWLAWQEFT